MGEWRYSSTHSPRHQMVVVVSFMLRPVYLPGTNPPATGGALQPMWALRHTEEPLQSNHDLSVLQPPVQPTTLTQSVRTGASCNFALHPHGVMRCCTKHRYPPLTDERQTEDKAGGGGGGGGGDRKAFCTKVSQAMPARPSGKG